MWANNEVGTVQPIASWPRSPPSTACRSTPTPCRPSAHCRSTSPAPASAALSLTGHKLGGPYGVGALLLRRDVACVPLLHGGGQERDVRSGTLDAAGIVGARDCRSARGRAARGRGRRGWRALRDGCATASWPRVPDAVVNGRAGQTACPATLHMSFPGCEGDSLLMLLDAARRRVLDRLGLLGRRGPAVARALAMGADPGARPRLAAVLPRPHLDRADVDAVLDAIAGVVERARRARDPRCPRRCARRARRTRRRDVARTRGVQWPNEGARRDERRRRLGGGRRPARSTPVTTSPACTWRCPQTPATLRDGARGCCTLEDARDARRAADVLGIPFYVWDLAERFRADVVDDFVAEYAAGRTPNPCLRCNEKIKFAAVLDRALALGFDAVVTGHHARLEDGVLRRSVDAAKDQSYVLAVLRPRPAGRTRCSRSATSTKAEVRAEAARARAGRGRQARLARHLLHRRRRHPRLPAPGPRRAAGADRRRRDRGRGRPARRRVRLHRRPAARAGAGPARRRPAVRAVDLAGDQHGHGRAGRAAGRGRGDRARPVWTAGAPPAERSRAWSSCGRTAGPCRRSPRSATAIEARLDGAGRGVAAGQALVLYAGDAVLGSATIATTARLRARRHLSRPPSA